MRENHVNEKYREEVIKFKPKTHPLKTEGGVPSAFQKVVRVRQAVAEARTISRGKVMWPSFRYFCRPSMTMARTSSRRAGDSCMSKGRKGAATSVNCSQYCSSVPVQTAGTESGCSFTF